jgi:hypothetical protein
MTDRATGAEMRKWKEGRPAGLVDCFCHLCGAKTGYRSPNLPASVPSVTCHNCIADAEVDRIFRQVDALRSARVERELNEPAVPLVDTKEKLTA